MLLYQKIFGIATRGSLKSPHHLVTHTDMFMDEMTEMRSAAKCYRVGDVGRMWVKQDWP